MNHDTDAELADAIPLAIALFVAAVFAVGAFAGVMLFC